MQSPSKAKPVSAKMGALVHLALPSPPGNAIDAKLLTLCGQPVVRQLEGPLRQHRQNRCTFCFNRVDPYGYPIGWLGKGFLAKR